MTSTTTWEDAKQIIGQTRVNLGPQATQQWLDQPEHLAMVLARYRAAAALIGDATSVLEIGCGEGIGARILAKRRYYWGIDTDAEAIRVAQEYAPLTTGEIGVQDVFTLGSYGANRFDAVVSLDVIEHISADLEDAFMHTATNAIGAHGVCVIGTPNATFDHLASSQSKAGHCNTYTHDRLHALMSRYFHVVQSFGMQDTSIHLGHPEARHYLLMAGVGPRRA